MVLERDNLQTTVQNFEEAKRLELTEVAEVWRLRMGKLVDDTKVRLREAKETKTRAAEVEAELESLKVQLEQANGSIRELNVLKERIVTVEAECTKAKQMADAQKSNAASFHREVVCQCLLM